MNDQNCHYEYTVRRGDSFYLIAHRLGVPLRDLLEANSSINPARLTVGDVLCIPVVSDEAPKAAAQTEAVPAQPAAPKAEPPAQKAETAPTPTQTITAEAAEPSGIVSEAPADAEPADLLDHPAVEEAPAQTPAATAADNVYTVAQDETVADIQLASGLTLHTLRTANPDVDLDALKAGQKLHIPSKNTPCPIVHTYTLRQGDTLESTALRLDLSIGTLLRTNPCLAPGDFTAGTVICVPAE